jgi:hypothetical protein
VRQAYELLALALSLEDDGRADHDVAAALAAAADGHVVSLQSAYASTLYLSHDLPLDEGAQRLAAILLKALEQVAAHEPVSPDAQTDTGWLDSENPPETARDVADRLATRAGDRTAAVRNAERLYADLERLRRPT